MAYENPFLMKENPYLQRAIDSAQSDVVRNYNLVTQPAYNTAQAKSGSFGNEGIQQMNENAQKNMQGSLADISTGMRFNDYNNQQGMYRWDQAFNRDVFNDAVGQNQSNMQLGMGLLGTLNNFNAQDLANATTIKNTPLNYQTQFVNQANATGGMGQTATSTQGTSSSPMTAALGGAQLGSSFQNWWNRTGNSASAPISQDNQNAFEAYGAGNNWWGTGG